MNTVPLWVQTALQNKLDAVAVGFAHNGYYEIEVESNDCEAWCGRIDADTFDLWDGGERDPTKRREGPSWTDLAIERL